MEWCKKNAHPYAVDFIHAGLTDANYAIEQDGFIIERDGTFSTNEFMRGLKRFYQATAKYIFVGATAPLLVANQNAPALVKE